MATTRIHETLSLIPLFAKLDPEAIRRLDSQCTWRRTPAKGSVLDYQDEGTSVFFVIHGIVRVVLRGAAPSRDVIFRDINAGGFFGELAAIDGQPRSASVVATTDAVTAEMPASVFLDVVQTNPSVSIQVLRSLSGRIRSLSERVNEFSSLNVRYRIYAELLRLSRPDSIEPRAAVVSPPPIHSDLAARVSTRREMVARELKSLERAGLLARRRGALVLTDHARLRQIVEEAHEAD